MTKKTEQSPPADTHSVSQDASKSSEAQRFFRQHGALPAGYVREVLGDPTEGVSGPVKTEELVCGKRSR